MNEIYFPMTADILTCGHIKCLEFLLKKGNIYIGLLTDEALIGYKKNVVPYKERFYVLETIAMALGGIEIVPQKSLNPTNNIKKLGCKFIASGDGWEKEELNTIKKLKLIPMDIKLQNEKGKKWSSSKIKEKIKSL